MRCYSAEVMGQRYKRLQWDLKEVNLNCKLVCLVVLYAGSLQRQPYIKNMRDESDEGFLTQNKFGGVSNSNRELKEILSIEPQEFRLDNYIEKESEKA